MCYHCPECWPGSYLQVSQFSTLLWGFPTICCSSFSLVLPPGSMVGFPRLSPLSPGRHSDSCPWLIILRHQQNGLTIPCSWCCGFHILIIFTGPATLLTWMRRLMLSNFRLGSTQTIIPTWLSYLSLNHFQPCSLNKRTMLSFWEWGMRTLLPLCSVYPRHTRNTLHVV